MSRMLQMTTEILLLFSKQSILDNQGLQYNILQLLFALFQSKLLYTYCGSSKLYNCAYLYNIHSLCIQLTFCAPALTSKQSQSCFWNPKFGFAIVRVLRTACSASATLSPVTEIMQAATMVTEREMPARLENQKRRVDSSTT